MDHRYILAWFVFIFCRVDGESLYGLKGLSISLDPAIPDKPADILWKHNGNKAVEFNGNEEQVYSTFKNRIILDWHTADIEITDLRFEDGGNYELEATIKNKLHRSSKTLVVIDKVPKPTISCKMIDDSSSNKSGTLECSADYKHSQTQSLLKFEWESHGNVQPGPQLTISLEDEHDDHEYICNVSNPKSSETTTFTAKDCYPDESSSVPLAVGLAVLFLIIFVVLVLGIAYSYRKRKACFAVKGDEEESTKKVSDDHNTTAQVKERELLLTPAASQPPHTGLDGTTALGDGNSQNDDEAYQRVPVQESVKMFEGKKDGNMNKGKAPPVRPRSALSPEAAKKEDPAVGLADLEEEKTSHQESSAAPEEPGLETTLSESELKEAEQDGEANVPSDSVFPSEELSPLTQNSPNVAPENAAGEQSEDMDKPISETEKEPANEEKDKEKESSAAPEEPGLETTLSESGSEQTTAQAEENSTPTDEAAANPPPDMTTGGKLNKGKAPPVPPCSELSLAEEEVPQSNPSVSEKANEPDQADESADSEEEKTSHQESSAAPEEPEVSDNHNTTAQIKEKEHLLPSSSSNQQPHTGLDVTTALGDGNSQNVDEAYQPVKVKERIKSFGGKKGSEMNKGKAPPVPPRSALSEAAKKEDPAVGLADSSAAPEEPGVETTLSESGSDQTTAQAEENSTPTDEAATDQQADRKIELKKEAEQDGEANVPSDSLFPAKALSSDTSQQPHSPTQTKPDNEHTNTLQESPDTPHKTPDQEKKVKTTQDSVESSEDEDETAQCGPKEEK